MTAEDKKELEKGWIDIEDQLPMMKGEDFLSGTTFKVKYKDGSEGSTIVMDHNMWYYLAKEADITHWWK